MILFFILFLAGYAVRCDDSNYYVIQMPQHDTPPHLQVYWNVPTMQCASKKIPFKNLQRFGIVQNRGDSFRGEVIAIMYDPGIFPALFRNESSGDLRFRNGGVPQEGNLDVHIKSFKNVLEQSIPDEGFSGIGIIDFESWRPILRQNFGDTLPYKAVSYEIEKNNHWWWPQPWIHSEAKQRFEDAAREFMQTTISIAKQMRPKARWGYYGFPYCFNMATNNMRESCGKNVDVENDQIDWLWMESTALYPSVYSFEALTSSQLSQLIRGRVKEAARVRRQDTPILPYFWYRYKDGGFLSQEDLHTALQTFNQSEASGFIIWGSSNDVNTVDKCKQLLNYVETVMGPAIAKYTLQSTIKNEVLNDDNAFSNDSKIDDGASTISGILISSVEDVTIESTAKPLNDDTDSTIVVTDRNSDDLSTEKPTKYQEEMVTEEVDKQKNGHDNSLAVLKKLNESVLIDLILSTLLNNLSKKHETVLTTEADNIIKSNEDVTTEKETSIIDYTIPPNSTEVVTGLTLESSSRNEKKEIIDSTEIGYLGDATTDFTEKFDLDTSTHVSTDPTQRLKDDKELTEYVTENKRITDIVQSNILDDTTTEIANEYDWYRNQNLINDELLNEKNEKKVNLHKKDETVTVSDIFSFTLVESETSTPTTKQYDEVTVEITDLNFNPDSLFNIDSFGDFSIDYSDLSTTEESMSYFDISTGKSDTSMSDVTENVYQNTNKKAPESIKLSRNDTVVSEELTKTSEIPTDLGDGTELTQSYVEPTIVFLRNNKKGVPRSANENLESDADMLLESSANQVLVRIV